MLFVITQALGFIFFEIFLDLIEIVNKKMASSISARKGMSRILDGIMKYRQTLRPSLLEEFRKVATGPSVKKKSFSTLIIENLFAVILSQKVFC